AARAHCTNNLRQIGLGLHNYHGVYNRFPPGAGYDEGRDAYPFMSWSARILPFIEQDNLWKATVAAYQQAKHFQDNPPHIGYSTVMPVFACPADGRTLAIGNAMGIPVALTSYLGGTGPFPP